MYSIFVDNTQPKPYCVEEIGASNIIQGLKIDKIISTHYNEADAYKAINRLEEAEKKQEFINEVIGKVFSEGMRSYFEKKTSNVFKTSEGLFIRFEKPDISKRFCFGYDEFIANDYEEASEACRSVCKEYFMNENLKGIEERIKSLKEQDVYLLQNYENSSKVFSWVTKEYTYRFPCLTPYMILPNDDKKLLIEMAEMELVKFKKRLETYYKKYGLTKLKTWTFSKND